MTMSTSDVVVRTLMADLLQGELIPGARIRQDELADRLGVSKIPVREALHRLSAIGLLEFETNRGAFVPTLRADDAAENYALRRAIEPALLRRSIPAMSIVDFAEAELALGAGHASRTESNWNFHRTLYAPSNWHRGLAMAEMLHAAVAPYVLLYTDGLGGARESSAEHHELLELCRRGRVEDAVTVLEQHLDHADETLVTFLQEMEG